MPERTKTKDELLGLRVVINDDFEELISLKVRDYMKEFDKVALDTTKMVGDEITPLDNRVASELKAQAYQSIDENLYQLIEIQIQFVNNLPIQFF